MAEQDKPQGEFPPKQTAERDARSTTGDDQPPRPGEESHEQGRSQEGVAGQGAGQIGGSGQQAK